jgi:hypothetical protein
VDGKDQTPYCLGAPISQEPQARLRTFATADGFDFIHAQAVSHEYPVVHERMVFFVVPEYWIVTDLLHGEGSHTYDLRFHLAPRALGRTTLRTGDKGTWVSSPNLLIAQPRLSDIHPAIEEGFVSPEYGVRQDAPIVKFTQKADETAFFHTVIYPHRTEQPALDVERLTVNNLYQFCSPTRATALKITIRSEAKQYSDYLFMAHEQPTGEYGFDDIVCRSQALFLRKDSDGCVVNLQAEGLERLQVGSTVLMEELAEGRRVSYRDDQRHSSTSVKTLRMALEPEQGHALSQLVRVNQT